MDVKIEDTSSSMCDDSLRLEERDWPSKMSRIVYTGSQRRQLEEAFRERRYLTVQTRGTLASSIGISERQIQTWFARRRFKWRQQQERTEMLQKLQKYARKVHTLNMELNSERIKTTSLNKKLNDINDKYDNLVLQKNKIARELEEESSMINQLNDKVQRLTQKLTQMKDLQKRVARELEKGTFEDQSAEWKIEEVNSKVDLNIKLEKKNRSGVRKGSVRVPLRKWYLGRSIMRAFSRS